MTRSERTLQNAQIEFDHANDIATAFWAILDDALATEDDVRIDRAVTDYAKAMEYFGVAARELEHCIQAFNVAAK